MRWGEMGGAREGTRSSREVDGLEERGKGGDVSGLEGGEASEGKGWGTGGSAREEDKTESGGVIGDRVRGVSILFCWRTVRICFRRRRFRRFWNLFAIAREW